MSKRCELYEKYKKYIPHMLCGLSLCSLAIILYFIGVSLRHLSELQEDHIIFRNQITRDVPDNRTCRNPIATRYSYSLCEPQFAAYIAYEQKTCNEILKDMGFGYPVYKDFGESDLTCINGTTVVVNSGYTFMMNHEMSQIEQDYFWNNDWIGCVADLSNSQISLEFRMPPNLTDFEVLRYYKNPEVRARTKEEEDNVRFEIIRSVVLIAITFFLTCIGIVSLTYIVHLCHEKHISYPTKV